MFNSGSPSLWQSPIPPPTLITSGKDFILWKRFYTLEKILQSSLFKTYSINEFNASFLNIFQYSCIFFFNSVCMAIKLHVYTLTHVTSLSLVRNWYMILMFTKACSVFQLECIAYIIRLQDDINFLLYYGLWGKFVFYIFKWCYTISYILKSA